MVRDLYHRLAKDGYKPWLDVESLLPGQDWQLEIPKAVKNSDVVLVCLSKNAVTKAGYVHKEIKFALDAADEKPEGMIFLIPVRLDECEIPVGLSKWHWVNLHHKGGYIKLKKALSSKLPEPFSAGSETLKIMVTGGRKITRELSSLSYSIGVQIISRGHVLLNNGSSGVDQSVAEGALSFCSANDLNILQKLIVYRPRRNPVPNFNYGTLQLVGETYSERRDFVLRASDVVIAIGGGGGTEQMLIQAQVAKTPIVPIGVGDKEMAAVRYWHRMEETKDDWKLNYISGEELKLIGPGAYNIEDVAQEAVIIAEQLVAKFRRKVLW